MEQYLSDLKKIREKVIQLETNPPSLPQEMRAAVTSLSTELVLKMSSVALKSTKHIEATPEQRTESLALIREINDRLDALTERLTGVKKEKKKKRGFLSRLFGRE